MSRTRVSVAMATYNGERFIHEQLESLLAQTLLPSEIVITDDRSSDATVSIIHEVLSDEVCRSRGITLVVRVNEKNLGPGGNFQHAISLCTADIIALADQDDVWFPQKLEVLVGMLEADPSLLLAHSDARLIDARGQRLSLSLSQGLAMTSEEKHALESGDSLPAILKRNLVTGTTAVFRRELGELAFRDSTIDLHDGRLAIVASLMDSLLFSPKELVGYRQHDGNQIGGKPLSFLDTLVALLKSWLDLTEVLSERNRELSDLLDLLGDRVSQRNRALVHRRIAHNAWRIGLPGTRVMRVWHVLWGTLRGRYRRFGRFPHDMMRDLVMPPREVFLGLVRTLSRWKL
jgi:glycosyltransferase involved in cell wall biosynthesis